MSQIISRKSVSFEKIRDDLKKYVSSQIETGASADVNQAVWKDFNESGSGETLIELISALGSFLSYTALANRRETYLHNALLDSSGRAIAETLGYSSYRGRNTHVKITMTSATSAILKRFNKIGEVTAGNVVVPVLVLENQELVAGIATEVKCVLGSLAQDTYQITTAKERVFRMESPLVSEDFDLTLDGQEIPLSTQVLDLINDHYVTLTNAFGSIDILHKNTDSKYPYKAGSTLNLTYVRLENHVELDLTSFKPVIGTFSEIILQTPYYEPDTLDEIRFKAPLQHEVAHVIRGRDDYMKLLRVYAPDLIDVAASDPEPSIVRLSYIKSDLSAMTIGEIDELTEKLAVHRSFGVMPPQIVASSMIEPVINVQIKLLNEFVGKVTTPQIQDDLIELVSKFELKLGRVVTLEDIEYECNSLDYVKVARVTLSNVDDLALAWNQFLQFSDVQVTLT